MSIQPVLQWLFGPHMFDVGAAICIGIGVAMALSPDQTDVSGALWFFGISALWAAGRAAHWLITEDSLPLPKPFLAVILFGAIGALWITSHTWAHGKLPIPAKAASEVKTESAGSDDPSVAFLYENHRLMIVNQGKEKLLLWGTKIAKGPMKISSEPREIPLQPLYYFLETADVEKALLADAPKLPHAEMHSDFFIFVETVARQKFTIKALLRFILDGGKVTTIYAQNLGASVGWTPISTETTNESKVQIDRPWVTIKTVGIRLRRGVPSAVRITFTNGGHTPATEVTTKWRMGVQPKPLVIAEQPPLVAFPGRSVSTLIPNADQSDENTGAVYPESIFQELESGKSSFYIYGVIEYKSPVFPKLEGVTGFCFRADRQALSGAPEIYHEGNYLK